MIPSPSPCPEAQPFPVKPLPVFFAVLIFFLIHCLNKIKAKGEVRDQDRPGGGGGGVVADDGRGGVGARAGPDGVSGAGGQYR
jgi:hypothetical protein